MLYLCFIYCDIETVFIPYFLLFWKHYTIMANELFYFSILIFSYIMLQFLCFNVFDLVWNNLILRSILQNRILVYNFQEFETMTKFKIKNSSLCFFIVYSFKFIIYKKKISFVYRAFNFAHFNYKLIYFYYISVFGAEKEEIKSFEKKKKRNNLFNYIPTT
jgi:hypothetical protein